MICRFNILRLFREKKKLGDSFKICSYYQNIWILADNFFFKCIKVLSGVQLSTVHIQTFLIWCLDILDNYYKKMLLFNQKIWRSETDKGSLVCNVNMCLQFSSCLPCVSLFHGFFKLSEWMCVFCIFCTRLCHAHEAYRILYE